MASMILTGDTSGTITLSAPLVAGSNTVTLPAATGSIPLLTQGTAVSATGNSVEFTGIPSWAKRVTVMLSGLTTTTGFSAIQFQLGDSGGIETTGYQTGSARTGASTTAATGYTTGFGVHIQSIQPYSGSVTFTTLGSNIWVGNGLFGHSATLFSLTTAGTKTLSDTLTQLRIISSATGSPSDTFTAGTINIMYEG